MFQILSKTVNGVLTTIKDVFPNFEEEISSQQQQNGHQIEGGDGKSEKTQDNLQANNHTGTDKN